jgi:uncharacterized DUF497 family protein
MRFISDEPMQEWLRDFVPDPERFDWDAGNERKGLKHGVAQGEIESIFFHSYLFAGRITEPAHDEWRGLILGESESERLLALIFTRRGDRIRPISCRPMRKKEREFYEANH